MAKKVSIKQKERSVFERGFVSIPLSLLVKADWNYKTENSALSAKLAENIKRNGQLENLVVRELPTGCFEIINGNHRYDVIQELGFAETMCYNLGAIGTAAAQRIAIELNETRFEADALKLAERLKEISEEFSLAELATTMPYSEEDLHRARQLLEFDFEQYRQQLAEHRGGLAGGESPDNEQGNTVQTLVFAMPFTLQQRWQDWCRLAREKFDTPTDEQCFEHALDAALRYHQS